MVTNKSTKDIEKNWENFKSKVSLLKDDNTVRLLEDLESGDKLRGLLSPYSTRVEYGGCFEGGLVETSLRVFSYMAKALTVFEPKVSKRSIILVSLFHNIGKTGTEEEKPYFIEEKSDWHRTKLGQYYNINPVFTNHSPSQISLYLLAKYGIAVNLEEWQAIASLAFEPNLNDTILSTLLKTATKISSLDLKIDPVWSDSD
jgi:hypothetical protein